MRNSTMTESTRVIIGNLDELNIPHVCTSIDTLTQIQICQARMDQSMIAQAACFGEMNARFEELTRQIQQVLNSRHECYQTAEIRRLASGIDYLKEETHKNQGSGKWADRVFNFGQGVISAAVIAVVLWFMMGGKIS